MLKRSLSYLKQSCVRYAHSIHPPADTARDVASAERMPAHNLAKTVVYFGDNGFGMVVLPSDCAADFAEIRRLLGLKDLRLATETVLATSSLPVPLSPVMRTVLSVSAIFSITS